MEKVTIYFKSGNVAVAYAESIKVTNHRDGTQSLQWYQLHGISSLPQFEHIADLEDIDAIITEYTPKTESAYE
jgi:hypothetical protein